MIAFTYFITPFLMKGKAILAINDDGKRISKIDHAKDIGYQIHIPSSPTDSAMESVICLKKCLILRIICLIFVGSNFGFGPGIINLNFFSNITLTKQDTK